MIKVMGKSVCVWSGYFSQYQLNLCMDHGFCSFHFQNIGNRPTLTMSLEFFTIIMSWLINLEDLNKSSQLYSTYRSVSWYVLYCDHLIAIHISWPTHIITTHIYIYICICIYIYIHQAGFGSAFVIHIHQAGFGSAFVKLKGCILGCTCIQICASQYLNIDLFILFVSTHLPAGVRPIWIKSIHIT